mgnify:CR=1 FL=1
MSPANPTPPDYDVAIIGGGVAGLWLLDRLQAAGHAVVLFEKHSLGGGQTGHSQGMIHGGIKYSLTGALTGASESIADMPAFWTECLAGTGEMDLSGVATLARDYYLFSDGRLASKIVAFFASKLMRGRVTVTAPHERPAVFQDLQFKGELYRLADLVVDAFSLIEVLYRRNRDAVFLAGAAISQTDEQVTLSLDDGQRVTARTCICAAGEGNEALLEAAKITDIPMQRRPLHQVSVTAPGLPAIHAHATALGSGEKPRVTFTTHLSAAGLPVWYLGGDLAETGARRDQTEQIAFAQAELAALLPWVSLDGALWKTHPINRAEPSLGGARPDLPFVGHAGNVLACWPVKLTLMPLLARQVLAEMPAPSITTTRQPPDLPPPPHATGPWDKLY